VDPVPDPLLFFCSARESNPGLRICSQELWPLDHRGGPTNVKLDEYLKRLAPSSTLLACVRTCAFATERDDKKLIREEGEGELKLKLDGICTFRLTKTDQTADLTSGTVPTEDGAHLRNVSFQHSRG
jgi:uncharacterized protein YeaO (DUF488 family)